MESNDYEQGGKEDLDKGNKFPIYLLYVFSVSIIQNYKYSCSLNICCCFRFEFVPKFVFTSRLFVKPLTLISSLVLFP